MKATFQFNTTFMYLIAVLMFMKLYQVRHSDVSANAVGVFFGLGVALFLETVSIYYSGPMILFVVCKILFSELKKLCVRKEGSEKQSHEARPRLVCLLLIALVNIALCLYFGISGTPGASNYLLLIFFTNLALYGTYYCAMKILCGERINPPTRTPT